MFRVGNLFLNNTSIEEDPMKAFDYNDIDLFRKELENSLEEKRPMHQDYLFVFERIASQITPEKSHYTKPS